MKKLIFITMVLLMALPSCNKDTTSKQKLTSSKNLSHVPVTNEDDIQGFIISSWMTDYLANHNYTLDGVGEKYQQDGKIAYRFPLKNKGNRTNEVSELIVYSYLDTKVLSPILVLKEELENYRTLKLINTLTDSEIAKAFISSDNDSIWGVAPCPQQGLSFSDCMICSLNDITSDWVGWAACAACPECCLIASGLACAMAIDDNDSDNNNIAGWINDNVGSDKYFKSYTQSGDKYIVN